MFRTIREELKGFMGYIFLMELLILPVIMIVNIITDNPTVRLAALVLYLVSFFAIIFMRNYQAHTFVSNHKIWNCTVQKSKRTSDKGKVFAIFDKVDLDIEREFEIEHLDSYGDYRQKAIIKLTNHIDKRRKSVNESVELYRKSRMEEYKKTDNKGKALKEADIKYVDKQIQDEKEEQFEHIKTYLAKEYSKPSISKSPKLFCYLVILGEKVKLSDDEIKFDTCVIITRREWDTEFDEEPDIEFIKGFYIPCQSCEVKLVRLSPIAEDIPIFFSHWTTKDLKDCYRKALSGEEANNIENRAMRNMIRAMRERFSGRIAIEEKFEDKIGELEEVNEVLDQRLYAAKVQNALLLGYGSGKENRKLYKIAYALGIWLFLSIGIITYLMAKKGDGIVG